MREFVTTALGTLIRVRNLQASLPRAADLFNPDFPLELVARANKMLKMREKTRNFFGAVAHSTVTNKISRFLVQIRHLDRSQ